LGGLKMVKKLAGDLLESGDDQVEALVTKPGQYVDKFAKSKHGKNIGSWAFIIGFVIAVIAGLIAGIQVVSPSFMAGTDIIGASTGLLVIIGVIVGLVNVSGKESVSFLIAAIAITVAPTGFSAMARATSIVGVGTGLSMIASFLTKLSGAIAVFVAPAAIIVALKVLYSTGRQA